MSVSAPRLTGRSLRAIARVLRSETVGAPLRRLVGAMVVEKKLAKVDFAGEGEPAPYYIPPRWRGAGGAGDER